MTAHRDYSISPFTTEIEPGRDDPEQQRLAAVRVGRQSTSAQDCDRLLDMLGLSEVGR